MKAFAALFVTLLALPAAASPFEASPERYDETVNLALQQVGIEVTGPADRPGTA